ncbi:AAA family ATPase, partial [Acinetobacter lactucae]|uniref:AAA family ATPase n=1 Tax=Acinetobacter lactucae TaxID=1785128 RepID=UPI00157FD528|nr:AAA family ATPase [Acinetobacter lactucae]
MSKITKIAKIENFGIFKNFDWDANLKYQNKQGQDEIYDFKDINILYGRNYSGKTSLSKIIRSLEKRAIPSKYDQPAFKIELSDGSTISQNNLSTFSYPIHVYNSDFLKENLKFIHDDSQNIESFSVTLGGDNQETLNRIQELKKELGSNEESSKTGINLSIENKKIGLESAQNNHQSKASTLNDLLANEATKNENSIKNQHQKFGDINYNITKLNRDITIVQSPIYKALTDIQIKENESLITQRDLPEPPLLSAYNLKFNELINSTDSVLKTVVGGSQKIDELISNGNLNNWVQTGFQLHHDRDTCAFCSNHFDEERRKILSQHFDEQTQKLQTRIKDGIQHLENELYSSSLNISFDITHYHEQYYDELQQLKSDLKISSDKQKVSIKQLQSLLEQKNAQLFTALEKDYPQDYSNEIEAILKKISEIRTACIEFNNGLTRKQKEAQEALRLNHVYHFLQTINFSNLKKEINSALEAIEPIKEELTRLNARKLEIDNEIKHEEDK